MFKKLATILISILIILITYISYNTYINNHKISIAIAKQIKVDNQVKNDMTYQLELLKNEFSKSNELIVLKGNVRVKPTITDADWKVIESKKDSPLKFLKAKFAEWKVRNIVVNAEYKYGYSYDMSQLELKQVDKTIVIHISKSDLNVEYVEENLDKTVIENEEIGLLAKKFSKEEYKAIMKSTKISVINYLSNNSELKDESIKNLKINLKNITSKFGIEDIQIQEENYIDTLPNNEANVTDINFE